MLAVLLLHASLQASEPAGLVQAAYIKASYVDANEGESDSFGVSLAIDGNLMVIGASEESSSATGINGDPANNDARRSGAAYVFRRSGSSWIQEAYLKAHNTFNSDRFGAAVDISGRRIVVGAPGEGVVVNGARTEANSGAAYVFVRCAGKWIQEAYLKASDYKTGEYFGYDVAIDRDTVVIGAPLDDLHPNGNPTLGKGSVSVFTRLSGIWIQTARLTASERDYGDNFGAQVDIDQGRIAASSPFEQSSATGVDGDQQDNSISQSGAVYVFHEVDGDWTQEAYLKANSTGTLRFGMGLAIDEDLVLVGAPLESSNAVGVDGDPGDPGPQASGAAYVFRKSDEGWRHEAYLKASNPGGTSPTDIWGDLFGSSVAACRDRIVVSAPFEDSESVGLDGDQGDADPGQGPTWTGGYSSGACYVFDRSENGWSQTHYVKASNTGFFDALGTEVALDEEWLIAGAFYEGSQSTGINGDQDDDGAFASGAVYAFHSRADRRRWPAANLRYHQGYPDLAILDFDSIPGNSYRILRSSNLVFDQTAEVLAEQYPAAEFGRTSFFIDINPPEKRAFYQLQENENPR